MSAVKTIGLLGGIGPQATMALVERIHHYAQQVIPKQANFGYPPLIVHYFRSAPVQVGEDMKPLQPIRPAPRFLEAAEQLGDQCDFLIMGANSPHVFQEQVEARAGVELLSMVQLAIQEIKRRGWVNVGLIGLGVPEIYVEQLQVVGINHTLLPIELRSRLDKAIFQVMEGTDGGAERAVAREAVDYLRALALDGIILGCTEVPLLLSDVGSADDLIDPADLLARAAVEYALE